MTGSMIARALAFVAILAVGSSLNAQEDLVSGEAAIVELTDAEPSLEFVYEVQGRSVVYLYAQSATLDPLLLVEDDDLEVLGEDDDSGGGTSACLELEGVAGESLWITLGAAKGIAEEFEGDVELKLTEVPRLEEEHLPLLEEARRRIDESDSARAGGDYEHAREFAKLAVDWLFDVSELLTVEVAAALWEGGFAANDAQDFLTANRAWERVWKIRSRTLPQDHPNLQLARLHLAVTVRVLGDLEGAKELFEQVHGVFSRTLPDEHPYLQAARGNLAATIFLLGNFEGAKELQERVLEVLSRTLTENHPDLLASRMNLALTIKSLGDLIGARELEAQVLDVRSRTLPNNHPDLQAARQNLAQTTRVLGNLEGARELEEQVLEVLSRTLPEDHPALLTAQQNLALTVKALGDLEGARKLEERVLEVRSRSLPEDHPDLQAARMNLAGTIKMLGDLKGARKLFEQVLEVRSRTLAKDHPDLLAACQNMALAIAGLGDLEGALRLEKHVLEVRSRTLPSDHPDLQWARGNLAVIMKDLGDLEGAKKLEEQVLEARSRTLPEDHPDLQVARQNMAATIYALGDLEGAKELYEQVLEVRSQTLAKDHPDLLSAYQNMALTIRALGDLEGALELEEHVLEVRSRILPEEHPDLQAARQNLASTIKLLGDLERARELEEQVFDVLSRTMPQDHPALQGARGNLALTIKDIGDLKSARELEEQVLEVRSRTLPDDHPDLQRARGNLAGTIQSLGDLNGARELQEQVLEVFSRSLPEDHPDLQTARQNLAVTIKLLGDFEGARELEEQVLKVRSRTLPEDHPYLQSARGNLAGTIYALGDLEGARELEKQVLEVFSRTLPDHHPDLLAASLSLAMTIKTLGDLEGARELEEQVVKVRSRTLSEDHPDLLTARRNLALTMARSSKREGLGKVLDALASGMIRRLRSFALLLSPRELRMMAAQESGRVSAVLSLSIVSEFRDRATPLLETGFSLVETLRGVEPALLRVLRTIDATADKQLRGFQAEVAQANQALVRLAGGEWRAPKQGVGTDDSWTLDRFQELRRAKEQAESRLSQHIAVMLRDRGLSRGKRGAIDDELLTSFTSGRLATVIEESSAAVGFWRYTFREIDEHAQTELPGVPSYLAHVLLADGTLERVELGPAAVVDESVRDWRASLGVGLQRGESGDNEVSELEAGRRLRELIFDPLVPHLGNATRLVMALDAVLHLVPFAALPCEEGVLGDRFEFSIRTTLRELLVPKTVSDSVRSLLVLGGVDYNLRSSLTLAPSASHSRSSGLTADLRHTDSWREFTALLATEGEVDLVANAFREKFSLDTGSRRLFLLKGQEGSRESLQELAPKARYLHLATHGYFLDESIPSMRDERVLDHELGFAASRSMQDQVRGYLPMILCGLALAGANAPANDFGRFPGILTAQELAQWDLSDCELAVLSACDTNVGVVRAGQGIASLQEALYAAGVRSSITSLWKVPDSATQELFAEFYRRLWLLGEGKAEALWGAQSSLRAKRHATRNWAGWVLVGDPD